MFFSRWLKTHPKLFLFSRLLLSKESQCIYLDYPLNRIPRNNHSSASFQALHRIMQQGDDRYFQLLKEMNQSAIDLKSGSPELIDWSWENGWFPPLDIMSLYSLVRTYKPRNIIEVGSGVSTRVICRAIVNHHIKSKLLCIDPEPRVSLNTPISTHMALPLEETNANVFKRLSKNDFLIIDGSHVGLMNSDVIVFFTEVLPHLNPGVIVHIHDVYLPYDYPFGNTAYNEQYFLSSLLLMKAKIGPLIFPSYYITQNKKFLKQKRLLSKTLMVPETLIHGGSFWFQTG